MYGTAMEQGMNQTLSRAPPLMPNPFNFTIPDTSPIFRYYPSRDGPIDSSWNVSFSGSLDSTWAAGTLGVGTSTHRTTLPGASVRLDWVGTAIYLYGEASVEAYTIELDGAATKVETNTPGLLFAKSNLTYGSHLLTLRVVRGTSISSAIITVGMGETGTIIQNRTIDTITVPLTTDGIVLTGTWYQDRNYSGAGPVPRIATNVVGSAISFPISSASAFYIVGHVNINHGPYLVTFTPPSDLGPVLTFEYNGLSRWGHLNTLMFLATGLNRSRTYHVQLTNQATSYYDQSQIVIIDTPPAPSHEPNPTPSSGSSSQQSLSAGSIAGIVIGVFLFLVVLIFLTLLWRKRRSSQTNAMTQYDSSAIVTSPSNPAISTASPPSWLIAQEWVPEYPTLSQSERNLPQLSAPSSFVNPECPPYPSGLTQEDARFFNNLYALNVPAADIATMMETLRARRDPAADATNMMMEGSSSSGAIRVEPEIVNSVPPRYDFKDSR